MKKVLIITNHFRPGFKAGGPVRSLEGLIEAQRENYKFSLFCLNHDFGEKKRFDQVESGKWLEFNGLESYYMDPDDLSYKKLYRAMQKSHAEIIYLNSFFSKLTRMVLILKYFGFLRQDIVLAPRGELSPGALSIKSFKKSLFLFFTRAFALFRSVKFQATSQDEKEEIQSLFSNSVVVAKNYSSFKVSPEQTSKQTWEEGSLKIIFLSRICKKKNLLYAVEVLQNVKANIEFDIYGTLEEPEYLDICLMTNKSPNIKVTYKGEVGSDQVFPTLKDYHLFFLPTLGENFGHVILEALASGVPALVSDKTYFRNLADQLMGFDLSFDRPDEFSKAIDSFSHFEEAEFRKWSQSAHKYGMNYLKSIVHDQSYIELFG